MSRAQVICFRSASHRLAHAARSVALALGLFGCGATSDDAPAVEPTATVMQKTDWHTSLPGNLGMGILWAGAPTTTGSQIYVADLAVDGVGFDQSTLFKTDTGKPVGGQGTESETFVGYGDFNGDGQTDLMWRTLLTGRIVIWEMTAHQAVRKIVSGNNAAPTFFSGPAKGHVADLNGDCISDIVWTGVVGSPSSWNYRTLIWIMRAGSPNPVQESFTDSFSQETIAVSNFDYDSEPNGTKLCGKADLLKRNSRGDGMVSLHTAAGTVTNIASVPTSTGWVVKGVGEFNGDGLGADVLWQNNTNGQLSIWTGGNGTMTSHGLLGTVPASSGWTIAGLGDFNGNFRSDILWQHKATRQTSIWRIDGPATVGAMMPGQPFVSGATIAGVMNVYDPPPPTELTYTISGNNATIQVKNNNYVRNGMGATRIEILHDTSSGLGSLTGWDATGTGFKTKTIPVAQLANGANTCLYAYVQYHGRYSTFSNAMCMANMPSTPMPPGTPTPDMRPNLGFPSGVQVCTPDLNDCSFFPRVGEEFTLSWYVCNNGSSTADESTTRVQATMNGAMGIADFDVGELAPGMCEFQQLEEDLTAEFEQDVFFSFHADGVNDVAESLEADNYASVHDFITN